MYYSFTTKSMVELSNEVFSQYNVRPDMFTGGQSLVFQEKEHAQQAVAGLQTNDIFHERIPIIPSATIVTSFVHATLENAPLTKDECKKIGISSDISVHRGTCEPEDMDSITVFFQRDALHDQYVMGASCKENGDIDIGEISAIARNRANAIDKLTDVLYLIPRAKRLAIIDGLQSTDMKNENGRLLKMALSTDPFKPQVLPTTALIAQSTKLDTKDMNGFVQTNPAGLDFGTRLLQQTIKALLHNVSAEVIFALPTLYTKYAENLNKYSNPNEMQCISAMGRALASIERVSINDMPHVMDLKYSLRDVQAMIMHQMQDSADKAITAVVQALPSDMQAPCWHQLIKSIDMDTKDELELMSQCYAAVASLAQFMQPGDYQKAHEALNEVWVSSDRQQQYQAQMSIFEPDNYKTFITSMLPTNDATHFEKEYQEELKWLQQRHPSMTPARMAIKAAQDILCDVQCITKDINTYQPIIEQTARDEQQLSELEALMLDETCI